MKFDRSRLPEDLPEEVVKALEAFTDEELKTLRANYYNGKFIGVGFSGEGGTYTKYANPEKYAATLVLEDQIRKELAAQTKEVIASGALGNRLNWVNS